MHKPVNSGDLAAWAILSLYEHAHEWIPRTLVPRLGGAHAMNDQQVRRLLAGARHALGKRDALTDRQYLTAAIQGMLHRHDPETVYTSPEKRRPWSCTLYIDRYEDIGVQLKKDGDTGCLRIVTPIKDGPAHKAGLYAGDRIVTITQRVDRFGERLSRPIRTHTSKRSLEDVRRLLAGVEGTNVTLTIQRPGRKKPFNVTLTRRRVEHETVLGVRRKKGAAWDFVVDRKDKIGYVRISNFGRNTCRDLNAALAELKNQGIEGVILDLRFNPGGLLNTAINVADMFIGQGDIVRIQRRGGPPQAATFSAEGALGVHRLPIVCLVNGDSALASELVAAALQDHKRAFIIGERSQGKARVQNIRDLEVRNPTTGAVEKAEIQCTTADFHRPSGRPLHRGATRGRAQDPWGVVPDKVVVLTVRERAALAAHLRERELIERPEHNRRPSFNDRQLAAAVEYLRGRMTGK